nr:cold-shock protein [Paenibacillus kobensis]
MYYSRKRPQEELPEQLTPIWSCSNENCKGWMRDNFAFSTTPICSLCQSEMVRSEKMLVALMNTSVAKTKSET